MEGSMVFLVLATTSLSFLIGRDALGGVLQAAGVDLHPKVFIKYFFTVKEDL